MFKISKLFTVKVAAYFVVIALGIALITLIVVLLHPVSTPRDTCKPIPDLPLEVSFGYNGFGSSVTVTWTESHDNVRCGVSYRIGYSTDGGDERVTHVYNRYLEITAVEICSLLQVRIRAVNKFGDTTAHFTERNYTLVPKQRPVVYVAAFDTAEGVTVTWQAPPELLRCNIQYSVSTQTELGPWNSEIVDVTSMNIPWYAYCMSLPIVISSWVNRELNSETFYHHISDRTLEGIQQRISAEDPEELIVSWRNDTHQKLCDLVYDVNYFATDPALHQKVVTATGEARFRFVYCMNAAIVIRTINSNGVLAGPHTYFDATQYPKNITDVQGYTIDISQENVTIISWLPAPTIETCDVTYRIQFTSDLGNLTYSDVTPPAVLPKASYCSVLGIELQILIGQYQVNSALVRISESLDKVQDLEFAPSIEPDTLLLKWSEHSKKEICGLNYQVTYQYSSHFEIFTTNQSSINLDTIYCVNISATVAVVRGDSIGEKNNITTYTGPPNIVGQVQNIAVVAENGIASVSWDSPLSVSQCNIWYNVTATNGVVDVAWCTGTSNCRLNLTDFCPSELVITASYLDEEPIIGEPFNIMYNCW